MISQLMYYGAAGGGFLIGGGLVWGILLLITGLKRKRQIGRMWRNVSTQVKIGDKDLACQSCGHNTFFKREGLLNTSLITLFGWGMWNKSCSCLVCKECNHLHWFASNVEAS